jgi:hypothetical protein
MNMSIELHQSVTEVHLDEVIDGVDDVLVEAIWHDLERQLPRERVSCVVATVALEFQDATVKAFLPILVHRRVLEQLRPEIDDMDSTDNRLLADQL